MGPPGALGVAARLASDPLGGGGAALACDRASSGQRCGFTRRLALSASLAPVKGQCH